MTLFSLPKNSLVLCDMAPMKHIYLFSLTKMCFHGSWSVRLSHQTHSLIYKQLPVPRQEKPPQAQWSSWAAGGPTTRPEGGLTGREAPDSTAGLHSGQPQPSGHPEPRRTAHLCHEEFTKLFSLPEPEYEKGLRKERLHFPQTIVVTFLEGT